MKHETRNSIDKTHTTKQKYLIYGRYQQLKILGKIQDSNKQKQFNSQ